MATLDEDFMYAVLEVVGEIPKGKVTTYGQIASLIGFESNARLVGRALSVSGIYELDYPCHRVVNAAGKLAANFTEQKALLLEEDILFKANGCVDLKKHLYVG